MGKTVRKNPISDRYTIHAFCLVLRLFDFLYSRRPLHKNMYTNHECFMEGDVKDAKN